MGKASRKAFYSRHQIVSSHSPAGSRAALLDSLQSVRDELAKLYGRAVTGNITSEDMSLAMHPLRVLMNSFDKTITQEINARVTFDESEIDTELRDATNALEDRLRKLLYQNDHLKKEWKILALSEKNYWTEEDERRLESRIERKIYIRIKNSDEPKPEKKFSDFDLDH